MSVLWGSISGLSGKEKNPWSEGYLTGCKIIYYESNSALDGRDDCFVTDWRNFRIIRGV